MKFGLDDSTIKNIENVFEAHAKVDEVVVFGSRAKGTYKEGSDIDLAVKGRNMRFDDILKLHGQLDYLNLPYTIDLLDYAAIKEPALVEHLDRVGIVFYARWKKLKLGELCNTIDYGYTASANDNAIGPKFLRITDIVPQRVNWKSVPYCKIDIKNHEKYKLEKGDIVIARTGATTGYNYTFNDDVDTVFASYLIRYKIDKLRANPFFINYSLKSDGWKGFVEGIIGGSAQPGANAKMFAEYELLLPPLNEQQNIVDILSSLDDKIDLLQRQKKTLEQLAETLFRQWFVEEADESWEVGTLNDVIDLSYGKALKEEIRTGTGFPVVGSSGIVNYHSEFLVEGPGIVIGRKGTLGKVIYLFDNFFPIDTSFFVKSKLNSVGLFYEYFLLKTLNFEDMNSDSAVPGLNRNIALSTEIKLPQKEKVFEFNNQCSTLFNKTKLNNFQIKQLTQLRDALLPKLMSGEVRVELEI